ncbi:hypothetical protein KBD18_00470 [Patescibacteria group bacterium]|nr:hypothetical protein [Patescibacteria group bacterium]
MIDQEIPTDRQLLETIAHTVDRVELNLFAFREEVGERFTRLEGKVDRLEDRVDHLENRFDTLEVRMEQRFEQIDTRFDQMDQRFDQMDDRFDTLEEQVGVAIMDHEERLVVLETQ